VQAGRRDRDVTPPPPRVQAMREAQADGKNVNGRPMGARPQDNAAQTGRPVAPNRPQGRDDDRSPNNGNSPAVAARPQQPGQADNVRDRDNNVRDRDGARPQVARPPMSQPGQRADREPGQHGIPQARRENDVPGFNQPHQQREREREHREVPGFQQQQREREQPRETRETREMPGFQQQREREQPREVQRPQPQPQPQPRAREERQERQVERHERPQQERQERPERRREDRRDGPNSQN
jgi:hypothetical protein